MSKKPERPEIEPAAKIWYKSKRLWVGAITIVASFIQLRWGLIIDGPTQGLILGIIFLIIGIVTDQPIAWTQFQIQEEEQQKIKDVESGDSARALEQEQL